jgi:transcriptional regulator with XRE-family HTH domain
MGQKLLQMKLPAEQTPRNRIRELREARGWSQEQLAAKAGTTHSVISRLESGERRLNSDNMQAIARALGVPWAELLEPIEESAGRTLRNIEVRGAAQTGIWGGGEDFPADRRYALRLPADERFPGMELYGVEVHGDGMNLVYPDGSLVVCVPMERMDNVIPHRARVHVLRQRLDGLVETSVREYRLQADGAAYLWPRSDSPDHQTPVLVKDDGMMRIAGLVVAAYTSERFSKSPV